MELDRGEDVCLADWALDAAGRLYDAAAGEGLLGRGPGVCLVAAVAVSADEDVDRAADGAVLGW